MLLANWLCAGPRASIRYRIAKKQFTPELPTCNLFVKKEIAKKFNLKFRPELLTEEDSKFCFDMAKNGKKVLYVPDVIVYHHRREALMPHLRQIWIYGRDVAFLFKKEVSIVMIYYTLLSLFVIGVFAGAILSFFNRFIRTIYIASVIFYLVITLAFSAKKDIKKTGVLFLGIIGTHFAYGLGFLYGLLSQNKAGLNVR
jgi:GT2 family glycosyltransferase